MMMQNLNLMHGRKTKLDTMRDDPMVSVVHAKIEVKARYVV